ncbi:MAG: hypothetical protein WCG06_00345 [Candidatus Omnitrophota bacterium]
MTIQSGASKYEIVFYADGSDRVRLSQSTNVYDYTYFESDKKLTVHHYDSKTGRTSLSMTLTTTSPEYDIYMTRFRTFLGTAYQSCMDASQRATIKQKIDLFNPVVPGTSINMDLPSAKYQIFLSDDFSKAQDLLICTNKKNNVTVQYNYSWAAGFLSFKINNTTQSYSVWEQNYAIMLASYTQTLKGAYDLCTNSIQKEAIAKRLDLIFGTSNSPDLQRFNPSIVYATKALRDAFSSLAGSVIYQSDYNVTLDNPIQTMGKRGSMMSFTITPKKSPSEGNITSLQVSFKVNNDFTASVYGNICTTYYTASLSTRIVDLYTTLQNTFPSGNPLSWIRQAADLTYLHPTRVWIRGVLYREYYNPYTGKKSFGRP